MVPPGPHSQCLRDECLGAEVGTWVLPQSITRVGGEVGTWCCHQHLPQVPNAQGAPELFSTPCPRCSCTELVASGWHQERVDGGGVEARVRLALWYIGLVNHTFQGLGLGSSVAN